MGFLCVLRVLRGEAVVWDSFVSFVSFAVKLLDGISFVFFVVKLFRGEAVGERHRYAATFKCPR